MQPAKETRLLSGARHEQAIAEVRATDTGGSVVTGYAAVFNRFSQNLGGFVEEIDPAAFNRTLNSADVMALENHDMNRVLGRSSAGTLRLSVDDTGLKYEIDAPNTTVARDLVENIRLRNITGSSFSFRVSENGDTWGYTEQGFPLRRVMDAELYDVGPVTFPAYLGTQEQDAAVALRSLADQTNTDLGEVIAAAKANDLRSVIEGESETAAPESDEKREADPAPASTGRTSAKYLRRLRLWEIDPPAAR